MKILYQLRIYTIESKKNAQEYFDVHWTKHIVSLKKFNIEVCDVYMEDEPDSKNCYRVIALVMAENKASLLSSNEEYMRSQAFEEDMQGFDMSAIKNVETINLNRKHF